MIHYLFDLRLLLDAVFGFGLVLWMRLGLDPSWYRLLKQFVAGGVLLGCISLMVMFLIWLERRLSGRFQSR
ncbi:MAG: hypothetical protein ACYC5N_02905, partial [Endomicrobiales bacterium]